MASRNGHNQLDHYTKEQREALLVKISDEAEAPTIVNDNRSELLELRSKLKNKAKNASKKETGDGCILALQQILNVKGIAGTEQLLSDLALFDIKLKSQKLETARQFLSCNNEIEHGPKALIRKTKQLFKKRSLNSHSETKLQASVQRAALN